MDRTDPSGAEPTTQPERLRALGASFADLVGIRFELAMVELREEAERRRQFAILAATAGVFVTLAALLFAMFVVIVFWDSHRVAAAAGMTVSYLAMGLAAFAHLARRRRKCPPAFQATLAELAQDFEALRGQRE